MNDLNAPPPSKLSSAIIADYHAIRDTSVTDQMPKSECLKSMGFSGVTLGVESGQLKSKTKYSIEDVRKIFSFKEQMGAARLQSVKERNEKAYNLVMTEQTDLYPELTALLNTMQSYMEAGIVVNIVGIE